VRVDVWLCKVLLHPGRVVQMRLDVLQPYYARVASGELACLDDGCIVEPIEQLRTEAEAHAARERKLVDEPGVDWRVVVVHVLDSGETA
jgi:hypothetical protein